MVIISGQSTITIESKSQGECDLIADMVSHFLIWARDGLCGSQGFKEFAMPLEVSDIGLVRDDTELYQVQIAIPWVKEEMWRVKTDALKIKNILTQIAAYDPYAESRRADHIKLYQKPD